MRETWVQSQGWEGLLEKEMAAHSSILAWKIPGPRSLVGYIQSVHGVAKNWTRLSDFTFTFKVLEVPQANNCEVIFILRLKDHWDGVVPGTQRNGEHHLIGGVVFEGRPTENKFPNVILPSALWCFPLIKVISKPQCLELH